MREEKPKLSAKDRLCLIQTINALPPPQFNELVFALNPPKGVVASSTAPQGTRSKDLLDWLEGPTGPGLAASDEVLQVLIPTATKTAPQPVAFAISGRMGDLPANELEAIVELLRQKTGDASLVLAFSREGSIKLILNGSPEGLAKLQELLEAGDLDQLDIPPVEAVAPVDSNSQDARKARLIQALSLRDQSSVKLNRASNLARDLVLALDRDRDRARASTLALVLALNIGIAHNRDLDRVIASTIARNLARDLGSVRDLDLDRASTLALDIDRALVRALSSVRNCNLSGADLSGANLRGINLSGVDLTGADLTHTDVTGTIFGGNPGITETDKRDLQSRGAIFQDPPRSDVPALVLR